ncbi:MAG TPA: methyltransferase [Anaerolineaceae bacterium]|nr:methyltransferase [Anaerolineaceae bacterium]
MWVIRGVLLGLWILLLSASGYFLSRRQNYKDLLENRVFNLGLVIIYSLLCYLMTALPSEPNVISPPSFFLQPDVRIIFVVIGAAIIGAAVLVMGMALRQRKTLGGQDVKEGLLTSGIYHYFRHPLYAGAIGVSLGLALVTLSWDGLLMVPVVFLANAVEAVIEERYDVGKRFPTQYQEYRKRTKMFGPIWAWAAILGCLLIAAIVPYPGK